MKVLHRIVTRLRRVSVPELHILIALSNCCLQLPFLIAAAQGPGDHYAEGVWPLLSDGLLPRAWPQRSRGQNLQGMDQISVKTPNPKCHIFLKNLRYQVKGLAAGVLGPLLSRVFVWGGIVFNFAGSNSGQIHSE